MQSAIGRSPPQKITVMRDLAVEQSVLCNLKNYRNKQYPLFIHDQESYCSNLNIADYCTPEQVQRRFN